MIISKNIIGVHISINKTKMERVHRYQHFGTVIYEQWDNADNGTK